MKIYCAKKYEDFRFQFHQASLPALPELCTALSHEILYIYLFYKAVNASVVMSLSSVRR